MKQLTLPLEFFPYCEYLGGFKHIRKSLGKVSKILSTWRQLPLKLYVQTIFKARTGFWWTRPDGRQFYCKTVRSLIARIMDYDGRLLQTTLRKYHQKKSPR